MDADPTTDVAVVAIAVAAAMGFVLQIRLMRLKARRQKPREEFIGDKAHNDLLTTRAIVQSLERGGITAPQIASLLEEAQDELDRGHHRQAMAGLERVRNLLSQAQRSQAAGGDVAKLEALGGEATEAPSPKAWQPSAQEAEALQARFAVGKAARSLGDRGNPPEASRMVEEAEAALRANDYKGALGKAQRALKALGQGEGIGRSPGARPSEVMACPSCGAPMAADGEPCPLCGALAPGPGSAPDR